MAAGFTITTWNVNSIRARLDHAASYLADHEPDIVCLQETKVDDNLFPRVPFLELGYTVTRHGSKAMAGVATMTKTKPTSTQLGFAEGDADRHARVLAAEVNGVNVYNLYCPNGTEVGSDAYRYKLDWFTRLRAELDAKFKPSDPVVVVGDFNVAPDDRDLWDPAGYVDRLLVTQDERAALQNLLDFGLVDCFRKHEDAGEHYTWFDYRTNGFARNQGMRIDFVLATEPLAQRCVSVVHDGEPRGWDTPSDHLPVTAKFE